MDPFLAEVVIFAGNFAPRGWAYCDGQLMPISQWSAVFSLVGTTYGGDGRTTFGLPDLRGRTPIGPRHGAGLSNYSLGQKGGVEQVYLNTTQIPAHNHASQFNLSSGPGTGGAGNNNYLANSSLGETIYSSVAPDGTNKLGNSIQGGNTGGNLPHENRQPYLAINYIFALQGVFPSRS